MSDEAKQRYQEAKDRRDKALEVQYKRNEEQLKVLADLKRYVFAGFLAVAVGIARSDDKFSVYAGVVVCLILLLVFAVLIVIRYKKINQYNDEYS